MSLLNLTNFLQIYSCRNQIWNNYM